MFNRRIPQDECIYCGETATTRDHVPSKLLLERPLPNNLKTVPCCLRCNRGFSLDEQYFWVLLGQISPAPTMVAKVAAGGIIDRTLQRSPALDERLIRSLEPDEDGGRISIKVEIDRVHRVIKKLATGLFVVRYGRVPSPGSIRVIGAYPYRLSDERPLPVFISTFTERFRQKQWKHVQPKVFSYIFVRHPRSSSKIWCVMDLHQTLWGVAEMPNPQSVKIRTQRQLWLFPDLNAA